MEPNNLKCEERLMKSAPIPLIQLACAKWINTRKSWDPELALHLAKSSHAIRTIVFDCDVIQEGPRRRLFYNFNTLKEIVEWEKADKKDILPYRSRWLGKKQKRNQVVVTLQDTIEIEDDCNDFNKRICSRLTD